MKKISISFLALLMGSFVFAQSLAPLTVEKIMRDPKWIGASPSNPLWSADGKTLYFNWNPDMAPADSLYYITSHNTIPKKVPSFQKEDIVYARDITFNAAKTAYVYAKEGDVFISDSKTGKIKRITQTAEVESAPGFSFNDTKVVYCLNYNLYAWDIANGEIIQLTAFQKGDDPLANEKSKKPNSQEEWLKEDQLNRIAVLKERKEKKDATDAYAKSLPETKKLRIIYTGSKSVRDLQISPGGRFVSYILLKEATGARHTIIPSYVTESGFTEDISGRTKVGAPFESAELFVFDRERDTVIAVTTEAIPGIRDLPGYVNDYPELLKKKKQENAVREVSIAKVTWSPKDNFAVVDIDARDNKDRWLMKLDAVTGKLSLLDRQRDEAWVGGPGINSGNTGWIGENLFWFQSEATGYSHIYTVNVATGQKTALTSGQYEVQQCRLSGDNKYFFITTNETHPGEQQLYRLPVTGGKAARITTMTGANQAVLSPGEKQVAILYSYSNKPWELYLQDNRPGGKTVQLTFKAQSEAFKSYPWRDPEFVSITASDGKQVPARLYRPANPHPSKPAVIFVHGAGYLQNAHKWWSSYFREYLFHNLLADNGYYVLDMDYRASAGYGRNWRTGIYRHMGGKDLTDNIDGAKYLIEKCGVNPKHIGIYGGSYGGFITLMALFTSPGTFAAGAALRPVTDWAHYNHGYTSNILNTPAEDSIAYRKSSPIYFAEGLQDHLLICHGVVDVNVHFQDVVRLNQRLIELGKNNWEVALYPVEDHGFVESSSWTDEYKRIFKLFEEVLK
ncbi:prolyl oligopeptidase family serine peptidase [Agriterribacter sp.]|uniref:S9 family peptidase n=1 Tax=Agriterribacter sp. TaxID=2821509 RepID=UPI002BD38E26|nr:prolyl oligopeptidase family serine peptidase [Agriterribacter sp.]HRO45465.1 prolyl oligopeptidase family serine peptidase [Agriterribacter sp.]HRQ18882.1 prolyl oligopeptidase family serine peptidase [Agriterribacter sp.]